jgi:hypothetical protein
MNSANALSFEATFAVAKIIIPHPNKGVVKPQLPHPILSSIEFLIPRIQGLSVVETNIM